MSTELRMAITWSAPSFANLTGNLGDSHSLLLGEVQDLGVVTETIRGQAFEHIAGDVAAEQLETRTACPRCPAAGRSGPGR